MKAVFTYDNNRLTIALSGELDHPGARDIMDKIMNKIDDTLPRDCHIDMGKVSFMDSSGIAIVLKAYKKVNAIGGRLWVENVQKQPMHVFDTAGIDRIIGISATV